MKLINLLKEAETFTAINKKTGKTSVFKSKDTKDAAIKAGTHSEPEKEKGGNSKTKLPKVNIFDKPASKGGPGSGRKPKADKPAEEPKKHNQIDTNSPETRTIQTYSNARPQAITDFVNKHKLDATALGNFLQKGSLSDRMDFITALVGKPGNKYEKKIIDKFAEKEEGGDVFSGDKSKPKPKESTNWSFGALSGPAAWVAANADAGLDPNLSYKEKDDFVGTWADENLIDLNKVADAVSNKKLKFTDIATALSGKPGNKYTKDIASKYPLEPKDFEKYAEKAQPEEGSIESLTSYKKLANFYKTNKDKLDKNYVDDIKGQIGALKYLESDYKRGDADWEEVLVAYEELQDLIKKGMSKQGDKGTPTQEPSSSTTSTPSDMGVDSVVYNKRTKTVGIVRLGDERGETKTDADGNVNTSELEPYNPMKYPHQKDAKVAPSTSKEIDSRGLWKPFAQDKDASKEEPTKDEPKVEPKKKRPGNPEVNKAAKKTAEQYGITPQKLGNEKYKKVMFQAAIEALTDSNFHSEARELVASIEGKPEWAKKVDYPSMNDPKYDEKMKAIRTTGVDSSEYWGGDDNAHELGRKVSQASGWDGVQAADGIAFTLRMNGFHKEADKIQSIFDNKPYMKNESISLKKLININRWGLV